VGGCYRCKTTVEPRISTQWFVKIKPLADEAIKDSPRWQNQDFTPDMGKTYFEWMYNIRDWCISRQIWWGHRIPVWYCQDCGHLNVSEIDPDSCEKCGSKNIEQDNDVLDTWFSSALWPFSTMGWPEKIKPWKNSTPQAALSQDLIFFSSGLLA